MVSICLMTRFGEGETDAIAEKSDEVVTVQVETGKWNAKRNILSLKEKKGVNKLVIAANR